MNTQTQEALRLIKVHDESGNIEDLVAAYNACKEALASNLAIPTITITQEKDPAAEAHPELYEQMMAYRGISKPAYRFAGAGKVIETAQEPSKLEMAAAELSGVIADVELFDGFDDVCLATIKRVRQTLTEYVEQPAQEAKTHTCTYSKTWMQSFPRKCVHCGKRE